MFSNWRPALTRPQHAVCTGHPKKMNNEWRMNCKILNISPVNMYYNGMWHSSSWVKFENRLTHYISCLIYSITIYVQINLWKKYSSFRNLPPISENIIAIGYLLLHCRAYRLARFVYLVLYIFIYLFLENFFRLLKYQCSITKLLFWVLQS